MHKAYFGESNDLFSIILLFEVLKQTMTFPVDCIWLGSSQDYHSPSARLPWLKIICHDQAYLLNDNVTQARGSRHVKVDSDRMCKHGRVETT